MSQLPKVGDRITWKYMAEGRLYDDTVTEVRLGDRHPPDLLLTACGYRVEPVAVITINGQSA